MSSLPSADKVNRLRIALEGETFTQKLADGTDVRMEFSPRQSNGQPPRTLAIYVNDQLRTLNFYDFERAGNRWSVAGIRIAHFDATSALVAVTQHDVAGLNGSPVAMDEAMDVFSGSSAFATELPGDGTFSSESYPSYCATEIIPSPECEGWEEACLSERVAFYTASAAHVAAEAALVFSLAGCPVSGVTCLSVPAAVLAVSLTGGALYSASLALDACQAASGGGGSGGGGDGTDCETFIIEVSDDGGVTWEYLGTVVVCS